MYSTQQFVSLHNITTNPVFSCENVLLVRKASQAYQAQEDLWRQQFFYAQVVSQEKFKGSAPQSTEKKDCIDIEFQEI